MVMHWPHLCPEHGHGGVCLCLVPAFLFLGNVTVSLSAESFSMSFVISLKLPVISCQSLS